MGFSLIPQSPPPHPPLTPFRGWFFLYFSTRLLGDTIAVHRVRSRPPPRPYVYAWTQINDYLFFIFSLTRCLSINREQHSPPQVYNKSNETRWDHFAVLGLISVKPGVYKLQLHPRHSCEPVEWLPTPSPGLKLLRPSPNTGICRLNAQERKYLHINSGIKKYFVHYLND